LSTTEARLGRSISLDQLIALNDEMSALVHAGVPLDRGLLAVGRDLRGGAGPLARRLGERLERGEALDSALEAEGRAIPSFYCSVVEAGLRSGKLSKALEGLAVYARNFAETRRAIGLALLYPLLVVTLAYGLFVAFVLMVAPRFSSAFESFRFGPMRSLAFFDWLGAHLAYWVAIVPIGLIFLASWWLRSGRAITLRPGRLDGLLRFIPGLGSVLSLAQAADFAELLALMVEHGVPLDEGIRLAAEATGSPTLRASADEVAEGLRRGDPLSILTKPRRGLPPMLAWVLATSEAQGSLATALRHAGETYRGRASRKSETLRAMLPTLLLCVVGALAAILYTVAVFQPLTMLWHDLSIPGAD
jgi:type II secretory pathway component PulF